MVKLTSIVTRTGDGGQTGLAAGTRIAKSSDLIGAMGAVDDANAAIGVAMTALSNSPLLDPLTEIQHDLFDLGSDLCRVEQENAKPKLTFSYVERLDALAEQYTETLAPLTSFILPGGSPAAAHLHVARTRTRAAEHLVWRVCQSYPMNEEIPKYLNRLSDILFLMARIANNNGTTDVLWQPGKSQNT